MRNTNAKINFSDYIKNNREKINKAAEANTTRSQDGRTVITKDDSWRKEKEWDKSYRGMDVF